MKKFFVVMMVILMTAVMFSAGCVDKNAPSDAKNIQSGPVSVTDYRNGVYYFDSNRAEFGNSLSQFIADHPELQFVSFAPDDTGTYGYTSGYFVVFKKTVNQTERH
jgi:outer membrane lipoprotein-sorting protein